MRACLGERAWTAAGARGLGREGPKDNPCLSLAQEEDKCLETVCKWRRNHKSQTAKEGTGAWGCWRHGGRKGRAARGMVGGRAANGWLYGNCELVVETPGWMETGFERQGYSWRQTRWCGEREAGIHDRSQLPALPRNLLVSKLVSAGGLTLSLTLPFQGQWDSSLATLPWPRACSLPSVRLSGLLQDRSLGNASLQGAQPHTGPPRLHRCTPSPPHSQPRMGCPTLTPSPFSPYPHFAHGSWFPAVHPNSRVSIQVPG